VTPKDVIIGQALAWLKAAVLVVLVFFTPIHKLLLLTTVLLAFDLVSGIAARLKRGIKITSSRFGGSIVKVFVYSVAMCASHIVESTFVPELPIVRMLAAMIGLRELLSIAENLNILAGRNLLDGLIATLKVANDKSAGVINDKPRPPETR